MERSRAPRTPDEARASVGPNGTALPNTVMLPARCGTFVRGRHVRLEQLYRIRFTYPQGWVVGPEGGWVQHLFLAEGRCEGCISGRFRGVNFPLRRTAAGPFCPD